MSYCINVRHLEKETIVSVEIHSVSEEFRSTRISQFQCIGWLLGIFDEAQRLVDRSDGLMNPGYDQEALERIAVMSSSEAEELLKLKSLNDRFEYVWSVIGQDGRETALMMDYDGYDNFWPGFDAYSLIWNPHSKPKAGKAFDLPENFSFPSFRYPDRSMEITTR